MKRDLDLIRKIIIYIEAKPDDHNLDPVEIAGYSRETVSYHLGLLADAGYVEAVNFGGEDQQAWFVKTLTWEGHNFADLLKSESLWNQAKSALLKATGTITIESLKFVLNEALNGRLQNHFKV